MHLATVEPLPDQDGGEMQRMYPGTALIVVIMRGETATGTEKSGDTVYTDLYAPGN